MNSADIKVDLFRKLDALKGKSLKEAYGLLLNYINSHQDPGDWNDLSDEQIDALNLGLSQLDRGEGKSHEDIITKFRDKYS